MSCNQTIRNKARTRSFRLLNLFQCTVWFITFPLILASIASKLCAWFSYPKLQMGKWCDRVITFGIWAFWHDDPFFFSYTFVFIYFKKYNPLWNRAVTSYDKTLRSVATTAEVHQHPLPCPACQLLSKYFSVIPSLSLHVRNS